MSIRRRLQRRTNPTSGRSFRPIVHAHAATDVSISLEPVKQVVASIASNLMAVRMRKMHDTIPGVRNEHNAH